MTTPSDAELAIAHTPAYPPGGQALHSHAANLTKARSVRPAKLTTAIIIDRETETPRTVSCLYIAHIARVHNPSSGLRQAT